MDKIIRSNVDTLIDKSFKYLDIIQAEYGLEGIDMCIFPISFTGKYTSAITMARDRVKFNLLTVSHPLAEPGPDGDDIIVGLMTGIYMSYESLYEVIINCRLDFDLAYESMKFCIKHEIGHILDDQHFIGRSISEWNNDADNILKSYNNMRKLRKNASYKSRLQWWLDYNHLPSELAANNLVGITDNDIIEEYMRTHRQ